MDRLRYYSNFSRGVISLDSKHRIYLFSLALLILYLVPVNFLESMPDLSICSRLFGDYCYSVGITRGVSTLFKGDLIGAINYNILAIPVLILLVGFVLFDSLSALRRVKKKN